MADRLPSQRYAMISADAMTRQKMGLRKALAWAQTQSNLGAAYRALGDEAEEPSYLRRAIAAYGLALEEQDRARVPLEWAGTQTNLSVALRALGALRSPRSGGSLGTLRSDLVPADGSVAGRALGAGDI